MKFVIFHPSSKNGEVNKVLDIGSGLGYLDERLLSEGFSVVGIEGNQKYHESAIKRFEDQAGKRRINRCKSRVRAVYYWYPCIPSGSTCLWRSNSSSY